MNISVLTNVFFPVTNGVVHSVHLISRGLKELEKDVIVISSKHPSFNHDIVQKYRINYKLIKLKSIYFPKVDYCIPNPFTLRDEIRRTNLRPDIIQVNHPFVIYKLSRIMKEYNPKSKVVFIYHTQYEQYYHYFKLIPKFIYERFLYKHLDEIFSFVDAVIFPSLSVKKSVQKNFEKYGDKFVFISNPVDLEHMEKYDEEKVNRLKVENDLKNKFVLGFVGRLEKEKNLYKLLNLFREVINFFKERNLDNIRLILVGGGSEYSNLVNYARFLDLQKYVIFTGKISYDDIPNYYRLIDVFITVSLTEVKPLSYLESLSVGAPIIALKTFGADDLILDGHNGFLIEHNDDYKKNFILKIFELYKNRDLLEKMKKNAYLSSLNYNYLKISTNYLDIYKSLI
ncbi:MAG: glycosyltransferase [Candidatus Calescibacterium sp.]|nr:glycosyltransferase [Candidatus Calescibacterium sp.]